MTATSSEGESGTREPPVGVGARASAPSHAPPEQPARHPSCLSMACLANQYHCCRLQVPPPAVLGHWPHHPQGCLNTGQAPDATLSPFSLPPARLVPSLLPLAGPRPADDPLICPTPARLPIACHAPLAPFRQVCRKAFHPCVAWAAVPALSWMSRLGPDHHPPPVQPPPPPSRPAVQAP